MATVKRKSTVPYYACALAWVLYAALFPLYLPRHYLFAAAAGGAVFLFTRLLCPDTVRQIDEPPREEKPTGNAELDKMLRDGGAALAQMRRLNESIRDPYLSAQIDRLEDVCGKIFAQVKSDPARLPQIGRFMDYYLPTTLKLLDSYDRMSAQGVDGENIAGTMERVKNVMETIVAAFEKQLDALFGAEAMDISTDVTVLENLLRREGLVTDALHEAAVQTPGAAGSGSVGSEL